MWTMLPGGAASPRPRWARTWSYCSGFAPVSMIRQIAMTRSFRELGRRPLVADDATAATAQRQAARPRMPQRRPHTPVYACAVNDTTPIAVLSSPKGADEAVELL